MVRVFIVDEREHPDPDPNLTIEQVRDMLADFYPELANATHTVTARGEDQVVDFRRTVGTKGETPKAFGPGGVVEAPGSLFHGLSGVQCRYILLALEKRLNASVGTTPDVARLMRAARLAGKRDAARATRL